MEIKLHTEFTFDSAHKLLMYDGICNQIHGHTWLCELWFKGDERYKDNVGILVDFGIVKSIKKDLDHKYLNDFFVSNPTAENISKFIYNGLRIAINTNIKIKVRLYETAVDKKTWCELGDW